MFRAAAAALLIACGALVPAATARPLGAPVAHAAATCADYPNQAAAQRAADTRDADGDGMTRAARRACAKTFAATRTASVATP